MSDDEKIEKIRERHKDVAWRYYEFPSQMHEDRATLLAEVDRLRAEIERLRAEIERLREALTDVANQETTGPYKWQLVVVRLCEIARETLEDKP